VNHRLWGLTINARDHLVLDGCDLVDLAEAHGTPLYVVDRGAVRRRFRTFLDAFRDAYGDAKVFYSYKTNCVPALLSVLHDDGCGAEVVSPFELWLAMRLRVPPARIVYNGVNKSLADLSAAAQQGVGLINVDSVGELRRLSRAAAELDRKVNVGLRIAPGVGWAAHFGLQPEGDWIAALIDEMKSSRLLNLVCLHAHIGTGIRDPADYQRTIKVLVSLSRKLKETAGVEIRTFDLGGGFGVPTMRSLTMPDLAIYKIFNRPPRAPAVDDCPPIETFASVIATSLRECCSRHGVKEPSLFLEPGRALTSQAQILLLTVHETKRRKSGRTYAITDGGMQNIAFPLSYEYHTCLLANRASARPTSRFFVTGPLCSNADILYRNWKMPELKEGDLLAVMDAGAYFTSFSNNFSFPRPPIVMVSDGVGSLVRRRESFEHMSVLDSPPS
jgi:diaminopimelate decarboxylase